MAAASEARAPAVAASPPKRTHRLWEEEESAFHAVALPFVQEPLCPAEPALSRAHLVAKGEGEADPERSPRRRFDLARVEVEMVRPLVDGDPLLVAPEHVRRRREQGEIRRRERL